MATSGSAIGRRHEWTRSWFSRGAWSFIGPLAFAALASPAIAQKADRPIVRVGDRWQFVEYYGIASTEPNRDWVVTSVTPSQIEGTENGELLTLTSELNVLESPRNKNSNPKALSFPLEIGKQWRFSSEWLFKLTGSKGSSIVDVEVVGHEKVSVPAGDFEAFKLVSKRNLRGVSLKNSLIEAEVTSTYWYAPAARTIVKSISRNPYIGVATVELVKFHPQP
jgi:hypothetical protein